MRAGPGEPGWPRPCGPPAVTGSMIAAVTDDQKPATLARNSDGDGN